MQSDLGHKRDGASNINFFEKHYAELKNWALKITNRNQELAEDMVHDTYLRLQGRRHILETVKDTNAYLYTTLKNEYISNLRKLQPEQLSTAENEIASATFLSTDPRMQLEVRDDLRAVCVYSCIRKETSKSASILIMRFFHGYSADEISQILNTSRNTIEARLLAARRELRLFFDSPSIDPVEFAGFDRKQKKKRIKNPVDLVSELREMVFSAKSERCPSPEKFREIYALGKNGFSRELLSHLVSCRECLEVVNKMLCFPPLSERHPLEASPRNRRTQKSRTMTAVGNAVALIFSIWNDFVLDFIFTLCQF